MGQDQSSKGAAKVQRKENQKKRDLIDDESHQKGDERKSRRGIP